MPHALVEIEPSHRAAVCQSLASFQFPFSLSGDQGVQAFVLRGCLFSAGQGLLLPEAFQRHLQTGASMLVCPSLTIDPGLTRNPSEPQSGLGWVCVYTRSPFLPLLLGGFPLWPGLSFESLPPTLPNQFPLLPCPGAVGRPGRTTIFGRVGKVLVCTSPLPARRIPPPPASLGIFQTGRLRH